MERELDEYYFRQEEPNKSCMMALRKIILAHELGLAEAWKYRMPFFCLRGKMFCYLWIDKQSKSPYVGIVEGGKLDHPDLVAGNRARMKVLYIDPEADIPVAMLSDILNQAGEFYR